MLSLDARGSGAAFAAGLLALAAAGATGPWMFARRPGERGLRPVGRGALRAADFGAVAALACAFVAWRTDGPAGPALAVGAFAGLYAFTAGALADLLRGGLLRPLVAGTAVALLLTLLWWDEPMLHRAADRKTSAALAFRLSAAAAASVTLDFDWIHAKALYTGNQTAESMLGVPRDGIGPFSARLAAGAGACVLLGWPRRRRPA